MNPIDITELARDPDAFLAKLHSRPYPMLVTRGGEPEAVIIRHMVYAPKLSRFVTMPTGDLLCTVCPSGTVVAHNAYDLGEAVETANKHWREVHRQQPAKARQQAQQAAPDAHPDHAASASYKPAQDPARGQS